MAMDKDELAKKRAAVVGSKKKSKNFGVMALTLGLVLVGAYIFLGRDAPRGPVSLTVPAAASATPGESERVYDPAEFADGKARFYDYTSVEGLRISYFLVRAKDGQIRSAFNACDACWREGKGYSQDDGEMICNNCKMRFKVEKVGEVKGGCNPSPLKTTLREGKIVVACAELETGKHLFDLNK